jgi:hypothetical protein
MQTPAATRPHHTTLYERRLPPYIPLMRPEIARTVEEIQQAVALLRRHL